MGNCSRSFEQLSRNSARKWAKTKENEAKMRVFLGITALFLIAAYFTGVLPGGIQ
jgi:hypothetical protein